MRVCTSIRRTSLCYYYSVPWPAAVSAASECYETGDGQTIGAAALAKRAGKKKYARRLKADAEKEEKRRGEKERRRYLGPDALRADFCESSAFAWEQFYGRNNSYSDRLWINKDIPMLSKPGAIALEVGCGVGMLHLLSLGCFPCRQCLQAMQHYLCCK